MKACDPGLAAYLAALRATPDAVVLYAECYTFTLLDGVVLRYTSADIDIVYGAHVFSASGPLIEGLRYRSTIGVNVDSQDVTISVGPDVLVGGAPFMTALADGAFDDCRIQRDRVFFADEIGGTLVGGVTLFKGRFVSIDEAGRASAQVTIADDLILLANQMPRNGYFVTCNHVLYDAGCGLNAESFKTATTAGAGSTDRTLLTAAALFAQIGGMIVFTSGVNAGVSATIKNAVVGQSLTLSYPLPQAPAAGDAFSIYLGCDHTLPTCASTFANQARFRGFPFVPPPQYAQ